MAQLLLFSKLLPEEGRQELALSRDEILTRLEGRGSGFFSKTAAMAALVSRMAWLQLPSELGATGVYCISDPHVPDEESVNFWLKSADEKPYKKFLKEISPTRALRIAPHTTTAAVSIAINAHGPEKTFCHGKFGVLHAIQQAEIDLRMQLISRAVIVTAFALEDDHSSHLRSNGLHLPMASKDGAACVVLGRDGGSDFKFELSESKNEHGIATSLIHLLEEIESGKNESN